MRVEQTSFDHLVETVDIRRFIYLCCKMDWKNIFGIGVSTTLTQGEIFLYGRLLLLYYVNLIVTVDFWKLFY